MNALNLNMIGAMQTTLEAWRAAGQGRKLMICRSVSDQLFFYGSGIRLIFADPDLGRKNSRSENLIFNPSQELRLAGFWLAAKKQPIGRHFSSLTEL